jgi:hypothetical protein
MASSAVTTAVEVFVVRTAMQGDAGTSFAAKILNKEGFESLLKLNGDRSGTWDIFDQIPNDGGNFDMHIRSAGLLMRLNSKEHSSARRQIHDANWGCVSVTEIHEGFWPDLSVQSWLRLMLWIDQTYSLAEMVDVDRQRDRLGRPRFGLFCLCCHRFVKHQRKPPKLSDRDE